MAGRLTISNAGSTSTLRLDSLDATNATPAYADDALTVQVPLPTSIQPGQVLILFVTDSASITPKVTADGGVHVLSNVATACRAGLPVVLGPFQFNHSSVIA